MEDYRVQWRSHATGALTDLSARAGGISTTDDLESLAVRMTLEVRQSVLDPYCRPLPIACGDRVALYKDGALAFEGQVSEVSGDWREKQTLTVYDDGVVLSQNDLVIQFNGVAADQAIRQLCARLGVGVGDLPGLPTSIAKIYHEAVGSILEDILDTVSAETGTRYLIRVRDRRLTVTPYGTTPLRTAVRLADNLPAHPIQTVAGRPEVRRSAEALRNAVIIYSDQDSGCSVLAEASHPDSVARYGRRCRAETYSDRHGATAAQKARTLLAELDREGEEVCVQTLGADNVTAGAVLHFDLEEFAGTFRVKAVTKHYEHPYTMELTLERMV